MKRQLSAIEISAEDSARRKSQIAQQNRTKTKNAKSQKSQYDAANKIQQVLAKCESLK
jgi:hypothetical protein